MWHAYKPLGCQCATSLAVLLKKFLGKPLCKSSCERVCATVLKMHVCECVHVCCCSCQETTTESQEEVEPSYHTLWLHVCVYERAEYTLVKTITLYTHIM